jgi:HupE / UreJ protein
MRRALASFGRPCASATRAALLGAAATLAWASPAGAHPLIQDQLWVVVAPDAIHLRVSATLREIAAAQALGADAVFDEESIRSGVASYPDYLLRHLRVRVRGEALDGRLVKLIPPAPGSYSEAPDRVFARYDLDFPVAASVPPSSVTVEQDVLRDVLYAPGQPWDVAYALRVKRVDRHEIASALLRAGEPFRYEPRWAGVPETPGFGTILLEYARHGIHHILTGFDHLLFVSALVLAALGLWDLAKVVAAFTVAHSLTLTLAVLGLVRLPPSVVEPLIAASIVFVAVENVAWPTRTRGRARLAVAFGFGLVHGMGFAGGLLDAMRELPKAQVVAAIASFSAGVETGHMMVVLPLFAILAVLRRRAPEWGARNLRYASVLISACGAYYLWVALSLPSLVGSVFAR